MVCKLVADVGWRLNPVEIGSAFFIRWRWQSEPRYSRKGAIVRAHNLPPAINKAVDPLELNKPDGGRKIIHGRQTPQADGIEFPPTCMATRCSFQPRPTAP